MTPSVLAAETQRAIERIRTAVEEQGAQVNVPVVPGTDAPHRHLLALRAIADAMEGTSDEVDETETADAETAEEPAAQSAKAPTKRGGKK